MIDAISANICPQLPGQGWTWAVWKQWGRIYRSTWSNRIPAGQLNKATRNNLTVHGPYPMLWFELEPANPNQNDTSIIIRVPLGVKGFVHDPRGIITNDFSKRLYALTIIDGLQCEKAQFNISLTYRKSVFLLTNLISTMEHSL